MDNAEVMRRFRAMNTDVLAVVCLSPERQAVGERSLPQMQRLFERVEEILSRFSSESELSRLNENAGQA